jgi:hypothetical protein
VASGDKTFIFDGGSWAPIGLAAAARLKVASMSSSDGMTAEFSISYFTSRFACHR